MEDLKPESAPGMWAGLLPTLVGRSGTYREAGLGLRVQVLGYRLDESWVGFDLRTRSGTFHFGGAREYAAFSPTGTGARIDILNVGTLLVDADAGRTAEDT